MHSFRRTRKSSNVRESAHLFLLGRATSLVALFAVAVFGVGCTKAELGEVRKAATGLEPREAVAILVSRDSRIAEDEMLHCINMALSEADPSLLIVPPDEFRRTAFPDLAPEAAPHGPQYLALLLEHPQFRDQMRQKSIRYVVSVRGETQQQDHGGMWCGAGYGGAGCLGVVWWDRESHLMASVFDFKEGRMSGEVHASASGRPWFAVIGIFPLGLPAFTETRACGELGKAVAKFLTGRNAREPSSRTDDR